jgi:hypothetical protein
MPYHDAGQTGNDEGFKLGALEVFVILCQMVFLIAGFKMINLYRFLNFL